MEQLWEQLPPSQLSFAIISGIICIVAIILFNPNTYNLNISAQPSTHGSFFSSHPMSSSSSHPYHQRTNHYHRNMNTNKHYSGNSGGNDYENHQQPPFNSMNKMHKNSNTCPNQECKNRNHHSHHHSHNHENSNRNKNPPLNTDPNSNIAQYLQKYVNPPTNFFFDPLDLRSSNPNCLKFFIFIAACGTLGSLLLYGRVILPIPDLTASISLMENVQETQIQMNSKMVEG